MCVVNDSVEDSIRYCLFANNVVSFVYMNLGGDNDIGFTMPVSALSHLVAAVVAGVAAPPLIRLGRGCPMRMMALAVYASCVVALLAISGTYHSLDRGGPARAFMQHVDYFAIWLLIAGTFTAVHGVMCSGFWRRGILTTRSS